jgi:hypothetical protein
MEIESGVQNFYCSGVKPLALFRSLKKTCTREKNQNISRACIPSIHPSALVPVPELPHPSNHQILSSPGVAMGHEKEGAGPSKTQ